MSLILTLTLNNLINQNILMGARRSCGQYQHPKSQNEKFQNGISQYSKTEYHIMDTD